MNEEDDLPPMPPSKIIKFRPSGRGKAQCPPNPAYPNGMDIESCPREYDGPRCVTQLPYPAPECGLYEVNCVFCMQTIAVTAAGRPDDPRSVSVKCRLSGMMRSFYETHILHEEHRAKKN